jgi:hypothetical protein
VITDGLPSGWPRPLSPSTPDLGPCDGHVLCRDIPYLDQGGAVSDAAASARAGRAASGRVPARRAVADICFAVAVEYVDPRWWASEERGNNGMHPALNLPVIMHSAHEAATAQLGSKRRLVSILFAPPEYLSVPQLCDNWARWDAETGARRVVGSILRRVLPRSRFRKWSANALL